MTNPIDDAHGSDDPRPRVFISYTRAELGSAKSVIALLEHAGFEVWWDGLLDGGVNYLPTTEAALESADCVVVLWSKLSVDSLWVRDEAQSGRERGCLVPLSLDGTFAPLGFRQFQLIDISGWSGDLQASEAQKIVAAVRGRVEAMGSAPSTQDKAGPATKPVSAEVPPPTHGPRISRRAAVIGGLGLAGGAAALGGWQSGLFSFGTSDAKAMSMAVMRFANLSGNDDQAWFSDGLSNELRQALSRNPMLRVSAPSSSTAVEGEDDFEIGRDLGVRNILRGSVQLVAETMRISAELVQIDGGLILWSDSYDRNFADVLAVQSEIAETVALSLVAQVASEGEVQRSLEEQKGVGGTENLQAYEAYLRGLALADLSSGADSDRSALAQFEAAIASDPAYAAAHAMRGTMLAAVANAAADSAESNALYDQCIAAARRSVELAPKLVRGHLTLGYGLSNGKLDPAAAYPHYKTAQELAPGDADTQGSVAIFYAYGDQQALATKMIEDVLLLDPLNARAFRAAGFIALLSREYDKTIARMGRALEINPQLASAQYAIGCARFMKGDFPAALAAFEAEPVKIFVLTGTAITQKKIGNSAAAQAAFDAILAEYGDASYYQQAQILAQWGDPAQAVALLEKAFAANDPGMLMTRNDPLLDPLRNQPALDRLLLRLSS